MTPEGLRDYLGRTALSRIVHVDANAIVLDLSAGARLLGKDIGAFDIDELDQAIARALLEAETGFGFGRYAEPRGFYLGDAFVSDSGERRSIHLGIDIYCRAGTPIRAPLAGEVALIANNAADFDYGPLVVLKHDAERDHFFTLYGHLDRTCLTALSPGQTVDAGVIFAAVGARPDNGNWPPHLHCQIILDLLSMGANFPGVAARSEQNRWLRLSPSPAAFFPEVEASRLDFSGA